MGRGCLAKGVTRAQIDAVGDERLTARLPAIEKFIKDLLAQADGNTHRGGVHTAVSSLLCRMGSVVLKVKKYPDLECSESPKSRQQLGTIDLEFRRDLAATGLELVANPILEVTKELLLGAEEESATGTAAVASPNPAAPVQFDATGALLKNSSYKAGLLNIGVGVRVVAKHDLSATAKRPAIAQGASGTVLAFTTSQVNVKWEMEPAQEIGVALSHLMLEADYDDAGPDSNPDPDPLPGSQPAKDTWNLEGPDIATAFVLGQLQAALAHLHLNMGAGPEQFAVSADRSTLTARQKADVASVWLFPQSGYLTVTKPPGDARFVTVNVSMKDAEDLQVYVQDPTEYGLADPSQAPCIPFWIVGCQPEDCAEEERIRELIHLDVSAHGAFEVQGDVGKRRPAKAPATFEIPAFQNPKVIEAGVALKGS